MIFKKQAIIFLVCLLCVSFVYAGAQEDLYRLTLVYYNASDGASPMKDMRGKVDMSCTNCPTWGSVGKIGTSIGMNSTDRVQTNSNGILARNTSSWSLSFWYRSYSNITGELMGANLTSTAKGHTDIWYNNAGAFNFLVYHYCDASNANLFQRNSWNRIGGWTHIVFVFYRNGTDSMEFWINGVNKSINSTPSATCGKMNPYNISRFFIGEYAGTNSLDVRLDEIAIFKKALNSSQIGYLYANNSPTSLQRFPYGYSNASHNPLIKSVNINPAVVYTNDTMLKGYCQGTDTKNATFFMQYKWYVNGIVNISGNRTVSNNTYKNVYNLSSTFSFRDNVTLSCRGYDKIGYSPWLNSSIKTVHQYINGYTLYANTLVYMKLEETGRIFYDYSNHVNATCSGTNCPINGTPGIINNGLNFSGTDYVIFDSNNKLNRNTSDWTLNMWIKRNSNTTGDFYSANFSGAFPQISIWATGSRVLVYNYQDAVNYRTISQNSVWDTYPGGWHMLTIVWYRKGASCSGNATSPCMELWVDGINQTVNSTGLGSAFSINLTRYVIGGGPDGAYDAKTDEVSIYKKALNASQISYLYSDGMPDSYSQAFPFGYVVPSGPHVPVIISANITPAIAYINDTLKGYCKATDSGNATFYMQYKWYINNILDGFGNRTVNNNTNANINNLSSDYFKENDNVILSCRAYDKKNYSAWLNSTARLINYTTNGSDFQKDTIVYMKFEDIGTTFVDSANHINATCNGVNCPGNSTSGKINNALYFNASDKVTFNSNNRLNRNNSDWTLNMWIKRYSNNTVGGDFYSANLSGTFPQIVVWGINKRLLVYAYKDASNYRTISQNSVWDTYPTGWHMFTVVWYRKGVSCSGNATSPCMELWIDGKNQTVNSTGLGTAFSINLTRHAIGGGLDGAYEGKIDEVGIFKKALNATQISYLYASGNPGGLQQYPFNNLDPVMSTAYIIPVYPLTNDTLKGYCKATDSNNASFLMYYKWYVNNTLNATGSKTVLENTDTNVANVSSSKLHKNDLWKIECRAYDKVAYSSKLNSSVVGVNSPAPIMSTAIILPSISYKNDTLKGYCKATDVNNASFIMYYKWFVNDTVNATGSKTVTNNTEKNIANISYSKIHTYDSWKIECRGYDKLLYGEKLNSSAKNISPSPPPVISTASILPSAPYVNDTLKGYCSATDINNATFFMYYKWFVNNTINATGNIIISNNTNKNVANKSGLHVDDYWKIECRAYDKTTYSNKLNSSVVLVLNNVSIVPVVTAASLFYNNVTNTLIGNCTAYNKNFSNISYKYVWWKNGVNISDSWKYGYDLRKNLTQAVNIGRYIFSDSKYIYTGSDDTRVRVYDRYTMALRATLTGSSDLIYAVWADGKRIYAGDRTKYIQYYNYSTFAYINQTADATLAIHGVWGDSKYLWGVSHDTKTYVYNITDMSLVKTITDASNLLKFVYINRTLVCTVGRDKIMRLYNATTLKSIYNISATPDEIYSCYIDRRYIYSSSLYGKVYIYNRTSPTYKSVINLSVIDGDFVRQVVSDEKQIYASGESRKISIYSTDTFAFIHNISLPSTAVALWVDKYWITTAQNTYQSLVFYKYKPYPNNTNVNVVNLTVLPIKGDIYKFGCRAYNDLRVSSWVNSSFINITAEHVPFVESVFIVPSILYTNDTARAYCRVTDSKNASLFIDYKIYRNGSLISSGTKIAANNTNKSIYNISSLHTLDSLVASCRARDGYSTTAYLNSSTYTAHNIIPIVLSVRILPSILYVNTNIIGECNTSGSSIKYYVWYRNGTNVSTSQNISASTLQHIDDIFVFGCKAYDGLNSSVWSNSSSKTIKNHVPVMVNVSLGDDTGIAYKNQSLKGYCNSTDGDNSSVKYYFKYYINGTKYEVFNETLLWNSVTTGGSGWWVDEANISDTKWYTYGHNSIGAGSSLMYFLYAKKNFTSGNYVWEVKDDGVRVNISLNSSCSSANSTHIKLRIYSNANTNTVIWSCCLNSDCSSLGKYRQYVGVSSNVYEQALHIISNISSFSSSSYVPSGIKKNVVNISASQLHIGDSWRLECRAFDGSNYSGKMNSSLVYILSPHIPTVLSIYINPSVLHKNDTAKSFCTIIDQKNVTFFMDYKIYRNGTSVASGTYTVVNNTNKNIYNLTNLHINDDIIASCRGRDGVNTSLYTNSSLYTVHNNVPVVQTVRILPPIAYVDTTLIGECNATDLDGDSLIKYYSWYRNGTNVSTSQNISASTLQHVNDVFMLRCRAYDGFNMSSWTNSSSKTIHNHVPVMVSSVLGDGSGIAYKNQSLKGYCNATHEDGTDIKYNFSMYRNGTKYNITYQTSYVVPEVQKNVINISKNELHYGDSWKIECSAYDGFNYSSKLNSSTVVIQNFVPVMNSVRLGDRIGKIYNSENVGAYCNASDADLSNVKYYYGLYVNNTNLYNIYYNKTLNWSNVSFGGDSWINSSKLYDKNWNTWGTDEHPGFGGAALIYFLYPKSNNSNGQYIWDVKDFVSRTNLTLNSTCINANSTHIKLRAYSNELTNTVIWSCCLNSDCSSLAAYKTIVFQGWIYEQALYTYFVGENTTAYYLQNKEINIFNLTANTFHINDLLKLQCRAFDGTSYSTKMNSSLYKIYEALHILNVSVYPIYPTADDNLSCSFNVVENTSKSVNVSITWYNSTNGSVYKQFTGADYTFVSALQNTTVTSGIGTGSVPSIYMKNYSSWKCQITTTNGISIFKQNSSTANITPLKISSLSPNNATYSNRRLNVTFIMNGFDVMNCSFSINNTKYIRIGLSDGQLVNFTYNPNFIGLYKWNLTCGNKYNSKSTAIYDWTYDNESALIYGYYNQTNVSYPHINDTVQIRSVIYDRYSIDTCKLMIKDGVLWVNQTTYSIKSLKHYTYNLTGNYTVNDLSSQYIYWRVWCNDSAGNINNSIIQTFEVIDTLLPKIDVYANSTFYINNTLITSHYQNLTISVNFSNFMLRNASIQVNCTHNGSIYLWSVNGLSVKYYVKNAIVDLDGYLLQSCNIRLYAEDTSSNTLIKRYAFSIAGVLNISYLNRYDNSTFLGGTTYAQFTSHIFNGTINDIIYGNRYILKANMTRGNYTIYVHNANYWNYTYIVEMKNPYQERLYQTGQAFIRLSAINIKTGLGIKGANFTIVQHPDAPLGNYTRFIQLSSFENYTNVFLNVSSFLHPINYTITARHPDYRAAVYNFSINRFNNLTVSISMPFNSTFFLVDENTLLPFNLSRPSKVRCFIFCKTETQQYTITSSNASIPLNCSYTKFQFVVEYNTTYFTSPFSYYRTFITASENVFNSTIYLIDATNTPYSFITFRIDDLFKRYENISVYIKKQIGNLSEIITSDFPDVEDKIPAYLLTNNQYFIEIHSNNMPTYVLGNYIPVVVSGESTIRLYDIALSEGKRTFINSVSQTFAVSNMSGSKFVIAHYIDDMNLTQALDIYIYKDRVNGTIIKQWHFVGGDNTSTNIIVLYNLSGTGYENDTIVGYMKYYHSLGSWHSFSQFIQLAAEKSLEIFNYVSSEFMNWAVTLLLGALAITGTISTASLMALIMVVLAAALAYFKIYAASWGLLGLAIVIAFINFLVGESKK